MHLALREQAVPSLQLPVRSARFDASKSPDSHVFSAGSHKGERLIRNLVEKMKGHAAPEHPVQVISGEAKARAPKKAKAPTKASGKKRAAKTKRAVPKRAPKRAVRKRPPKKGAKARRK